MNKKKGYPRKPYSFERVLKDLADDIGYENIETVIEKKRKAIEHISNPNFKDRQLHIQDGLELDIHCKKLGKGTPFLTAYETLLRKEIADQKKLEEAVASEDANGDDSDKPTPTKKGPMYEENKRESTNSYPSLTSI